MQYLVETPNKEYGGKAFGIKFNKGKAIVSQDVLDKSVGLTAEQVALRMQEEFGYTVTPPPEGEGREERGKRKEERRTWQGVSRQRAIIGCRAGT